MEELNEIKILHIENILNYFRCYLKLLEIN